MRSTSSVLVFVLGCGDGGGSSPADTPISEPHLITVSTGTATDAAYAFQDGDGPWQLTPASSGGIITLPITAPRYAVARLCGPSRTTQIAYRAATEDELSFPCNTFVDPTDKITGTITSTPDDSHQLLHGFGFAFESDANPSFTYELATSGTSDFVVVREPASGDAVDIMHVERDLAVSGTVTRDLDIATFEAPVTIAQPIPGGNGAAYTAFMPNADLYQFSMDFVEPFAHIALPVAARRATDRYDVGVIVDLAPDSTVQFDAILAVPTAVTAPTTNLLDPIDVTTGDTLTVQWNKIASASTSASIGDNDGFAFTSFSAAWQDTFTANLAFTVPDLSTVVGWPARGALRSPPLDVTITSVTEHGAFPDDGYEAEVFQRRFSTVNAAQKPAARRAVERARWNARFSRNGDGLD